MKNFKIALVIAIFFMMAGLFVMYAVGGNKTAETAAKTQQSEEGEVAGANLKDDSDYTARLAKELKNKGAVLYCSKETADCKEQSDEFGDNFQYIDYVECDATQDYANVDECQAHQIEVYPTWLYEGKQYTGVQSLADLAKIIAFQ